VLANSYQNSRTLIVCTPRMAHLRPYNVAPGGLSKTAGSI